jgi:hypothetical protein
VDAGYEREHPRRPLRAHVGSALQVAQREEEVRRSEQLLGIVEAAQAWG